MKLNDRQTALSRLVRQFFDKPRIRALTETMVAPLEAIEEDLLALQEQRWIETAQGKQLDGCGEIAGVARMGRNDEEYRAAIKAKILSNISSATPGALIAGVRFLTAPTEVQYLESYPACALLFSDGAVIPAQSQAILQDMAPASVENLPLMVSYGRAKALRTGKLSHPVSLWVARENQPGPLDTTQGLLNIATGSPAGASRLAGMELIKTPIAANGASIDVGIGVLAIGTFSVADNGYHLTGVFQ